MRERLRMKIEERNERQQRRGMREKKKRGRGGEDG